MNSTELKPCPFCGGKAEIVKRNVEPQGDPWYGSKVESFVLCGCGACLFDGDFHEGFYDPETRAVEAWNRRASINSVVCEAGGWRPIETAPKDGTDVLLFSDGIGFAAGCFFTREEAGCFYGWFGTCADGRVITSPTHWQPLPPPPGSARDSAEADKTKAGEVPGG